MKHLVALTLFIVMCSITPQLTQSTPIDGSNDWAWEQMKFDSVWQHTKGAGTTVAIFDYENSYD